MINVNGAMIIQCDNCDKQITIDADNAPFENVNSEEKSGGTETSYQYEDTITCDCSQEINIIYDAYEYPDGIMNHIEIDVIGGSLISGFDINFQIQDEDY
jgi:hypothetical protein